MGNSVLQKLIDQGPVMRTVSLPRGRHPCTPCRPAPATRCATDSTYDWDGRKRGQTPFTVLQHTISGAATCDTRTARFG
jgi:hypothetical protein